MSKAPGFEKHPNYTIELEPIGAKVRVLMGDTLVCETTRALRVTETRHRPVYYLPLADVDAKLLTPTDTETYCPFKGRARYWSVSVADATVLDVLWGYSEPYDECAKLRDYVAFYTDKVRLEVDGVVTGAEGPGWTQA